jgi:molybdopterin-guanine dinucleotide biosynthesis protein A
MITPSMRRVDGFILAGGASRRMGTDKCNLILEGQTSLDHVANAMLAVCRTVTVIGRELNHRALKGTPDIHVTWGALGGIHTALTTCETDWGLIVACDMPYVTTQLFDRLISFATDFDAVAPIQADLTPQPLCSLYRKAPCLTFAEALIKSGERKPITLLQSVRTRWVMFKELSDLVAADLFFENLNTPEDLSRAKSRGNVFATEDERTTLG